MDAFPGPEEEEILTGRHSSRRGRMRARVKVQEMARRVLQLFSQPVAYGVAIAILEPTESEVEVDYTDLPYGTLVRITASCHNEQLVGQPGYVFGDVDDNGEVLVGFADGSSEYFGVGIAEMTNPDREIELIAINQRKVVVAISSQRLEVEYPKDLEIKPGDTVKLSRSTSQILGVVGLEDYGEIVTVQRVVDDDRCEIDFHGARRMILAGQFTGEIEVGFRVIIDSSATVIVDCLGEEESFLTLTDETDVTWEDIAGLDEIKETLREAVVGHLDEPELYAHYGQKPIVGAALIGPPGCGKTMLGKALATEIVRLAKDRSIPVGFIYVKGPEILEKWVGTAEGRIRRLFLRAEYYKKRYGLPVVIFIDEAEAILPKRGEGVSSDVRDTIVPMFLAEMSGMKESSAIVLVATNRPDVLDPAVTRDGRCDLKLYVGRPDREAAAAIFRLYLGQLPLAEGLTVDRLVEIAVNRLFAEEYGLYRIEMLPDDDSKGKRTETFTLGHLVSGAMIKGIVDRAARLAIKRDKAAGGQPTGVHDDNLIEAVAAVFKENQPLNHHDAVQERMRLLTEKPARVTKLKQASN
ncbi:MAG: AAA family ATPase [Patescibacteria group bacterium]